MRPSLVLALWLEDSVAPSSRLEAWRTLLAARAGGMEVRLLDLRPSAGDESELSPAEAALLDTLAEEGARRERPGPAEVHRALEEAGSLLVLAAPGRKGHPPLCVVDGAWLRAMAAAPGEALRQAGQVMREPGA